MTAVWKHELRSCVHSLSAWLYCAFMLAFVGVGAMLYNIQAAVANFEYVLSFVCIGLVFIVPVLTMRSLAEERKQKTDQLLYSLPLKLWHIIAGKYLALLAVFLVPLVIIAFYPLVFSQYQRVHGVAAENGDDRRDPHRLCGGGHLCGGKTEDEAPWVIGKNCIFCWVCWHWCAARYFW